MVSVTPQQFPLAVVALVVLVVVVVPMMLMAQLDLLTLPKALVSLQSPMGLALVVEAWAVLDVDGTCCEACPHQACTRHSCPISCSDP